MSVVISREHLEKYLAEELFGETEIFEQLIQCFAEEVAELKNAQGDLVQIAHFAHKLKPGCLTYGAEALSMDLHRLEILAKSGRSREAIELYTYVVPDLDIMVLQIQKIAASLR